MALGRERVRTVYANDNSRLACEWYQRWHGDTPDCCDVRSVERLPDCDVLCAGFPCAQWYAGYTTSGEGLCSDSDSGAMLSPPNS